MGGFLDRCVQNGFLSKETTGEPQRQNEGKYIDFWNRLSPQQRESLSGGSLEGSGNTQDTEKSNPSQIVQLGNNRKFLPSNFTLEFQEVAIITATEGVFIWRIAGRIREYAGY